MVAKAAGRRAAPARAGRDLPAHGPDARRRSKRSSRRCAARRTIPTLLRAGGEAYLASSNPTKAARVSTSGRPRSTRATSPSQVRLAQVRLAAGDTARAFKDLEALSAAESAQSGPDLALISAHLRRREFDKALAAVDRAGKEAARQPAGPQHQGRRSTWRSATARARAQASRRRSKLDPDYTAARTTWRSSTSRSSNADGARKRYEQMLAKDPKNEQALLALAELLVRNARRRRPRSRRRSTRDRRQSRRRSAPRLALIGYYAQLKDAKAALAAAQAAQAAFPEQPADPGSAGRGAAGRRRDQPGARDVQRARPSCSRRTRRRCCASPASRLALKDYDGAIDDAAPGDRAAARSARRRGSRWPAST